MQNPIMDKTHRILNEMLANLEEVLESDIVCLHGPITPELIELVKDEVEALKKDSCREKLSVILTTNGGDANATERIAGGNRMVVH